MDPQTQDRKPVQTDWLDPFPKPHTIPAGWDMSGFLSAPETESDPPADSTAQAERGERPRAHRNSGSLS
ncbi:MAG TPA: hypothetical protein VLZ89_06850 [Anaerolineales bacterium]|nr:hypothetical protein [Anaerolineales bacterium]